MHSTFHPGRCFTTIFLCFILSLPACTFRPEPLTMVEIAERTADDLVGMYTDQEPLDGDLTLYLAMARAIKYNLDYRLQLMEKAMAQKILNTSNYDLLPQLAANAGYNSLSDHSGASSLALTGPTKGQESLVTSTSQEKDTRTADITVMWNVLDFGIGYFRAKQNADKILVAEEMRRKVIQNIIQDVRYAYWRAAGSEQLLQEMISLLDRAQYAYDQSRKASGQNLQPRLETLMYQRELLNDIRILWGLIQTLVPAKTELATLMNVNPNTPFMLDSPAPDRVAIPEFTGQSAELMKMAMLYRPELREGDYQARIDEAEINKTYLSMIPGLNFQLGYNYDSNSYLYTNDWYSTGINATLNLINLMAGPSNLKVARTKLELDEMRRQALAGGIMAQVQISLQRFGAAREEFLITDNLHQVDVELSEQMVAEKQSGRVTTLAMIKSETEAMISRVRRQIAYSELQNAAGMVYNSLGIDLMPGTVDSLDVRTLASELEKSFTQWEQKINSPQQNSES